MEAIIFNAEHECNLIFAVQKFAEFEEYVDVVIVCRDNKLKAHSLLLAAASPFMKSLLENQCSGCKQDIVVVLPDVRYSIMYLVVNFLYTGYMKLDETELNEFYDVVELLQIDIEKLTSGKHPFKDRIKKPKLSINQKYQTPHVSGEQQGTKLVADTSEKTKHPDDTNQGREYSGTDKNVDNTSVTNCGTSAEKDDSFVGFPSVEGEVELPMGLDDPLNVPDYYFPSQISPPGDATQDGRIVSSNSPTTRREETATLASNVITQPPSVDPLASVISSRQMGEKRKIVVDKKSEGRKVKREPGLPIEPRECDGSVEKSGEPSQNEDVRMAIYGYFDKELSQHIMPSDDDISKCMQLNTDTLSGVTCSQIRNFISVEIQRNKGKETKVSDDTLEKDDGKLKPALRTKGAIKAAVLSYFHRFITEKRIPCKTECLECIEAEWNILKNVSWLTVKSIVTNNINNSKKGNSSVKGLKRNSPQKTEVRGKCIMSISGRSAVLKYFSKTISQKKSVSKDECTACLIVHPESLQNECWENVRATVRNEIVKLVSKEKRMRKMKSADSRKNCLQTSVPKRIGSQPIVETNPEARSEQYSMRTRCRKINYSSKRARRCRDPNRIPVQSKSGRIIRRRVLQYSEMATSQEWKSSRKDSNSLADDVNKLKDEDVSDVLKVDGTGKMTEKHTPNEQVKPHEGTKHIRFWTKQELRTVMDYFESHIAMGTRPKLEEAERCIETNKSILQGRNCNSIILQVLKISKENKSSEMTEAIQTTTDSTQKLNPKSSAATQKSILQYFTSQNVNCSESDDKETTTSVTKEEIEGGDQDDLSSDVVYIPEKKSLGHSSKKLGSVGLKSLSLLNVSKRRKGIALNHSQTELLEKFCEEYLSRGVNPPKIACCNLIESSQQLRGFKWKKVYNYFRKRQSELARGTVQTSSKRHWWGSEEIALVHKHFKSYIRKSSYPKLEELKSFVEENKNVLQDRSEYAVRDIVKRAFHRKSKSLKRKKGSNYSNTATSESSNTVQTTTSLDPPTITATTKDALASKDVDVGNIEGKNDGSDGKVSNSTVQSNAPVKKRGRPCKKKFISSKGPNNSNLDTSQSYTPVEITRLDSPIITETKKDTSNEMDLKNIDGKNDSSDGKVSHSTEQSNAVMKKRRGRPPKKKRVSDEDSYYEVETVQQSSTCEEKPLVYRYWGKGEKALVYKHFKTFIRKGTYPTKSRIKQFLEENKETLKFRTLNAVVDFIRKEIWRKRKLLEKKGCNNGTSDTILPSKIVETVAVKLPTIPKVKDDSLVSDGVDSMFSNVEENAGSDDNMALQVRKRRGYPRRKQTITHKAESRECHPWTKEEKEVVFEYFKKNIVAGTRPKRSETEQCIEANRSMLSNRQWTDVYLLVTKKIRKVKEPLCIEGSAEFSSKDSALSETSSLNETSSLFSFPSRVSTSSSSHVSQLDASAEIDSSVFGSSQKEVLDNFMKDYVLNDTNPTKSDCELLVQTNQELEGITWLQVFNYCRRPMNRTKFLFDL